MIRIILLYSILLAHLHAIGQTIKIGSPMVTQHNKSQYKAGNQNWSLDFDQSGVLYAGNTEGLLSFDGNYWNLYQLPNKTTIRSVKVHSDGKIFVGGHGEFGYWESSSIGTMRYSSLSNLIIDKSTLKNDEIWRIIVNNDKIYFQAFSKCYVFENGEITQITGHGEPFLFIHQSKNKIFFEQIPSGLFELSSTNLVQIKDNNILQGKNILCILSFGNNFLIGTANHGLYKLQQDGKIKYWDCEASDILKQNQINNGLLLPSGQYVFGTIKGGVFIIDENGRILQNINKNKGLQNNTVLSLAVDKQNNLWCGLDNGIDRIAINSLIYYFTDLKGELGTVYTSEIFDNKIYLGTNQGLFVSNWSNKNFDFELITGSNGQVWNLSIINNQLICGHNNGTYIVDNKSIKSISPITGGYFFQKTTDNKYIIQGNYTGLSLFENGSNIQFLKKFTEYSEPILYSASNNTNNYWIGNNSDIKLIQFNSTNQTIKEIYNTKKDSSLNEVNFKGIYQLENSIVFTTDKGIYIYDEVLKKVLPYNQLNNKLQNFRFSNKIIAKEPQQYWFINQSKIAKVTFKQNSTLTIDSFSFNILHNKMMKSHENILKISPQQYLIGLDYGFAIFHDIPVSYTKFSIRPIINKIFNISNDIKIIEDNTQKIPYDENNIRITYSTPYFDNNGIKYQYILEGYSDTLSHWDHTAYKDFTNLPAGKYKFKVRSKINDGEVSDFNTFEFSIKYPWYFNPWSVTLYVLAVAFGVHQLLKFNKHKVIQKQFALKKELLLKQEEKLQREREIREKEIIELKNQQLEKELSIKNRELSNAATNIIYKNQMLNTLHEELKELKDMEGNKLGDEELRKISKLVDSAQNDNRDWDIFEKSFNDAHENFFKKLKVGYPDLVPNDLKLCAYLRLNMTSKEIASLLNITTRGVEIRRYRLRKKLNLNKDKNLTEFLLEL